MLDYFSLFGLAPQFELDARQLEVAYFALQREHHPDRLVNLPPAERAQRLQISADVNEGYRVLKSPLPRAQHLLALRGIHVNSERDTVKPSQELLMEVMAWREALAESPESRAAVVAEVTAAQQKTLARLADCFMQSHWDDAAQETLRLNYLTKLNEDARIVSSRRMPGSP